MKGSHQTLRNVCTFISRSGLALPSAYSQWMIYRFFLFEFDIVIIMQLFNWHRTSTAFWSACRIWRLESASNTWSWGSKHWPITATSLQPDYIQHKNNNINNNNNNNHKHPPFFLRHCILQECVGGCEVKTYDEWFLFRWDLSLFFLSFFPPALHLLNKNMSTQCDWCDEFILLLRNGGVLVVVKNNLVWKMVLQLWPFIYNGFAQSRGRNYNEEKKLK